MMARKSKLVLDWKALDTAVAGEVESKTHDIRGRAQSSGKGTYGDSVQFGFPGSRGQPRTHGLVFTDDIEAMRDTARNNTLLKAAQGG